MSVLLLTDPQPAAPIAQAIAALDPQLPVFTDLATAPLAQVQCVAAYRLAPGVLPRLPNLRLLCAASSGVEKLLAVPDLPADLPVVRVTDPAQAEQIAQFVCGHAIAHVRQFARYRSQQAETQWQRHAPPRFGQSRALVVGLGHTGQVVARMLGQVGFQVAGWSRTATPVAGVEVLHDTAALAQALASTDVVVSTLPLTSATRCWFDADRLAQLPASALLINVGRGEVVDDDALAQALRSQHLAGAVLDVHWQEPLPPQAPQWQVPGLVVSPHVASQPSPDAVARTVVQAMQRLQRGEPHPNRVERGQGY